MIKYVTRIDSPTIVLKLMGRTRTFSNEEIVYENVFVKNYPQYFKRIGEEIGYSHYMAKPTFIPDPIKDFVRMEGVRREAKKEVVKIIEEIEEVEEIEDIFKNEDELIEVDVKIETEEYIDEDKTKS